MSFIKSLFIAIVITLILTYAIGAGALDFVGVDFSWNDSTEVALENLNHSGLVTMVGIFGLVFVLLLSFGVMILVVGIILMVMLLALIGVFWPIILAVLVLYLLVKPENNKQGKTIHIIR
ncbi:MAG: hypothetical protein ACSHW0_03900 [Thalassotalea sp.]